MKTVTGRVHSTKPISISKAASILSKFVSAETGASQAVRAYLRRASLSFNELSQLHKELKPHCRHKTPKSKSKIATEDENPTRKAVSSRQTSQPELTQEFTRRSDSGVENERRKHKKKRRGEIERLEESKGKMGIEEDGNLGIDNDMMKQKKHKKMEKTGGEIGNLEEGKGKVGIEVDGDVGIENERKKHRKKEEKTESKFSNIEENGGGIVVQEEERRKKRKRKNGEVEEGSEMNSEELHSKKIKKRKSERQS